MRLFRMLQLKPKHLENVQLELPSSSKTTRIGAIDRKSTAYDVWALGDDEADAVGGDELRVVSCLLPRRKKGGKLYQGASFFLFLPAARSFHAFGRCM